MSVQSNIIWIFKVPYIPKSYIRHHKYQRKPTLVPIYYGEEHCK